MNKTFFFAFVSIFLATGICKAQFCNLPPEKVTLEQWRKVIADECYTIKFTDTQGKKFTPETFVFLYTPQAGEGFTYRSETGLMTEEMKKALQMAVPGDMYFFFSENKKVSMPFQMNGKAKYTYIYTIIP